MIEGMLQQMLENEIQADDRARETLLKQGKACRKERGIQTLSDLDEEFLREEEDVLAERIQEEERLDLEAVQNAKKEKRNERFAKIKEPILTEPIR